MRRRSGLDARPAFVRRQRGYSEAMDDAQALIEALGLAPHPEGGW
jgi:hypothetical protein